MKPTRHVLFASCLTALLGVSALTLHAGSAAKAAATPPTALTNASPQEVQIPRSVFVWPKTQKDGRDPFFPNSIRPYGSVVTAKTNAAPATVNLVLQSLAGPPNHRLAMINNMTFDVGEENEVNAGGTRVRVRLIQIIEEPPSVEIEAGGVRRMLRMKPF